MLSYNSHRGLASIMKFWWLMVLVPTLAGFGTLALSALQTKTVTARAQVILTDLSVPQLHSIPGTVSARLRLADEALRAGSTPVLDTAASSLGLEPETLKGSVVVRPAEDATAFVIDAKSGDFKTSVEWANAVMTAYEDTVRRERAERVAELIVSVESLLEATEAEVSKLTEQISSIDQQISGGAGGLAATRADLVKDQRLLSNEVVSLNKQIRNLAAELEIFDGGIDFKIQADAASAVVEPNIRRNFVLALALGLVLAAAMAWSFNNPDGVMSYITGQGQVVGPGYEPDNSWMRVPASHRAEPRHHTTQAQHGLAEGSVDPSFSRQPPSRVPVGLGRLRSDSFDRSAADDSFEFGSQGGLRPPAR